MTQLKVGEFLEYLAPGKWQECPAWPADVFALSSALLEKSGGYTRLGTAFWPVKGWARPDESGEWSEDWTEHVIQIANRWRELVTTSLEVQAGIPTNRLPGMAELYLERVPKQVEDCWNSMVQSRESPVSTMSDQVVENLIRLVSYSDQCLEGVGIEAVSLDDADNRFRHFLFKIKAEQLLVPKEESGSTLCEIVHASRLRVLPKSRTPRSGLSLRSLSHHVCACPPINIDAKWHMHVAPELTSESDPAQDCYFNLLLVPWPRKILPSQFMRITTSGHEKQTTIPSNTGWFGFKPESNSHGETVGELISMIDEATRSIGPIHAVVFPELCLTTERFNEFRVPLAKKNVGIIAGVFDVSSASEWKINCAQVSFPAGTLSLHRHVAYRQKKHHRWRLDESQIVRYGLASQLDPGKEWWEGIDVTERSLNFLRLREWLTTCVLVCEDLARIDPVGRFVRSVAPDLVIALLMDGPQLKDRWPAYQATVLADDPGSSVLTFTCEGMVRMSRPKDRLAGDGLPVVAMWRDCITGTTEIPLKAGSKGIVLTLRRHFEPEGEALTADGRDHVGDFGMPVFGGVNYI
jgi:hypothetical protein